MVDKEEWSLKGKELLYIDGVLYGKETISKEEYERKYGKTDLTELVIPSKEELEKAKKIYFAKDIETLHQKSIDDFVGFIDYVGENPDDFVNAAKRHIEVINKRFGVKHG